MRTLAYLSFPDRVCAAGASAEDRPAFTPARTAARSTRAQTARACRVRRDPARTRVRDARHDQDDVIEVTCGTCQGLARAQGRSDLEMVAERARIVRTGGSPFVRTPPRDHAGASAVAQRRGRRLPGARREQSERRLRRARPEPLVRTRDQLQRGGRRRGGIAAGRAAALGGRVLRQARRRRRLRRVVRCGQGARPQEGRLRRGAADPVRRDLEPGADGADDRHAAGSGSSQTTPSDTTRWPRLSKAT